MKSTPINARLIVLNAALAEQLEYAVLQLNLYRSPADTASKRLVIEARSLIRQSKKLK